MTDRTRFYVVQPNHTGPGRLHDGELVSTHRTRAAAVKRAEGGRKQGREWCVTDAHKSDRRHIQHPGRKSDDPHRI